MRLLYIFRPGTLLKLVQHVVPDGRMADKTVRLRPVPDTWAMPGGGTKTTDEVRELAKVENLTVDLVKRCG